MKLRLTVIPEPAKNTRSVFISDNDNDDFVFFQGSAGDIDLVCGNCERVLVHGLYANQMQNLVMKCPACGEFNETIDG